MATPPSRKTTPAHDSYAALRLPAFRRYFIGNSAMIFGLQMQKVAVGWEVYEYTRSAIHLGYVGLAQFAPLVALTIIGGHVTDTHDRKRVLMASLSLTAIAAFLLAWNSASIGSVRLIYVLLVAHGVARAFQAPARSSFLPGIVPRGIFPNAVSWNSSGFELSSMAGPAVGGFLIAWLHSPTIIYIINGVAALAYIVLVAGIQHERPPVVKSPITLRSLSAGLRFIFKTPVLLSAMTLDMVGVLLGGATALMPIFARDILHVGPRGLGWLLAAPSVGAFSMAMLQAHRPPLREAGKTMLLAMAGFGAVTVVFGLSSNFALSLAMLFGLGVCDNISVVVRTTLVQLITPDEFRGRVSAINGLFIGTSNELGGFESGLVAGIAGPVFSVVSGGLGTILVVIGVAWMWPQLRRYGTLGSPVS